MTTKDYILGEEYERPCVVTSDGTKVPVLLPAHEDRDFCMTDVVAHYHIDYRFYAGEIEHTTVLKATLPLATGSFVFHRELVENKGLVFPLVELIRAFKTTNLRRNCMICPHKGIYLGDRAANADGIIHCPGHGLPWDAGTGEIGVVLPLMFELAGMPKPILAELPFSVMLMHPILWFIEVNKGLLIKLHDNSGKLLAVQN